MCLFFSFGVQIAYEDTSLSLSLKTDKDIKIQTKFKIMLYHMQLKSNVCFLCFNLFTLVLEAAFQLNPKAKIKIEKELINYKTVTRIYLTLL